MIDVKHIMSRKAPSHFAKRVRERVSEDICPDQLFTGIIAAVATGRTDLVQKVKRDKSDGTEWYRVGTDYGRFYVPMCVGRDGLLFPLTIYTHEFYRRKRRVITLRNRGR